jgi:hypothetical protein
MILIFFLFSYSAYVISETFQVESPFLPSLFNIIDQINKNADAAPIVVLKERMYYIFDQDFGLNASPIFLPNNITFLPSNCLGKSICSEMVLIDVRTERFAFALSKEFQKIKEKKLILILFIFFLT